jgi:ATP-dependent exoDNAse (exonuclease V) alpha subunit
MYLINTPELELANGSRGRVTFIGADSITVKFFHLDEPIDVRPVRRPFDIGGQTLAEWRGYPLVQAHAVTIHKGQGMTSPALVELERAFEWALVYVAASRAPTLNDFYYRGALPPRLPVDKETIAYYKELDSGPTITQLAASACVPNLPVFAASQA